MQREKCRVVNLIWQTRVTTKAHEGDLCVIGGTSRVEGTPDCNLPHKQVRIAFKLIKYQIKLNASYGNWFLDISIMVKIGVVDEVKS